MSQPLIHLPMLNAIQFDFPEGLNSNADLFVEPYSDYIYFNILPIERSAHETILGFYNDQGSKKSEAKEWHFGADLELGFRKKGNSTTNKIYVEIRSGLIETDDNRASVESGDLSVASTNEIQQEMIFGQIGIDDNRESFDIRHLPMVSITAVHEEMTFGQRETDHNRVPFEFGDLKAAPCDVCFKMRLFTARACCSYKICSECSATYIMSQIVENINKVIIECPSCSKLLSVNEIKFRLKYSLFPEVLEIFEKRLRERVLAKDMFLCANCSSAIQGTSGTFLSSSNLQIACPACGFLTCSNCRSQWHKGFTCKEYRKGEKSMKKWAAGNDFRRRATKCPGCRGWYQKIDGCNHMKCARCNITFCYVCGDKYRKIKFVGCHDSKFSVVGCKGILLREHPLLRKIVRGSILGASIVGVVILLPVAVVVVVPVAAVSLVAVFAVTFCRGFPDYWRRRNSPVPDHTGLELMKGVVTKDPMISCSGVQLG